MFAYCNNNPVNYSDPSGYAGILTSVIIVVSVGITNGAVNAYTGGSFWAGFAGGAAGAAIGLLTSWAMPLCLNVSATTADLTARAVGSIICNYATAGIDEGSIINDRTPANTFDVVMDVCYSCVFYYYTDPVKQIAKESGVAFLNTMLDIGIDAMEAILYSDVESSTKPSSNAGGGKYFVSTCYSVR